MYIFFPHKKVNDLFYISGEENNHLKVRRIRIGEQIGIIYNERIYKCVLKERGRDISTAQVVEVLAPQKPDIEITLYQSVTVHLATMDLIVQKSVELGVIRFVPLVTERSFRNITVVNRKIPRWEGGFTKAEADGLRGKGFVSLRLKQTSYTKSRDRRYSCSWHHSEPCRFLILIP